MDSFDCVVIGAGVVGLATARRLALAGRRVVVLEGEPEIGQHTSSHNSGVIHAGVYHPGHSLKGRLCVSGKHMLYRYLAERDVPHQRTGKLLVAAQHDDVPALGRMEKQAVDCGVDDLVTLSAEEICAREPEIRAVAGLWSPSSGIVDTQALMSAFAVDLEAAGGCVLVSSPVLGGRVGNGFVELEVGGDAPFRLRCKSLVNSAGLRAPSVAKTIHGAHQRFVPGEHFALGHYFALREPPPFKHLVYPMAAPNIAHIHLVLGLSGEVRFGPDIAWTPTPRYVFGEDRAAAFYKAIRRYYPALADGDLVPDGVGIRPKVAPETSRGADFMIHGPEVHGTSGLVNLFGIESPGLTACLAVAEEVAQRLRCEPDAAYTP
ncbi:MAG: NAD(P)/FAD-dependent oxidoreductase [Polyangiales bacterium]